MCVASVNTREAQNTTYASRSSSQYASGAQVMPAVSGETLTWRWSDQCTRSVDSHTSMYWLPETCARPQSPLRPIERSVAMR